MKIKIECDCGNKIIIPAPPKKYTQFKDWLETQQFHLGKAKINNNELEEIRIECDKCKTWIDLGID